MARNTHNPRPPLSELVRDVMETSHVMVALESHTGELGVQEHKLVHMMVESYIKEAVAQRAGFDTQSGACFHGSDFDRRVKGFLGTLRDQPKNKGDEIEPLMDQDTIEQMKIRMDESLEKLWPLYPVTKAQSSPSCEALAKDSIGLSNFDNLIGTSLQLISGDRTIPDDPVNARYAELMGKANSDYVLNRIVEKAGFSLDPSQQTEQLLGATEALTQQNMDIGAIKSVLGTYIDRLLLLKVGKEAVQQATYNPKAQMQITLDAYETNVAKQIGAAFGKGVA